MSITDAGFTLSAYGHGWSTPPNSPAITARELIARLTPEHNHATVYHGDESAAVTRHLDGWVVMSATGDRPWHVELQQLLRVQEEGDAHAHPADGPDR